MRTYSRKRPQPQEIEDVQSSCRLCLGKSNEMMQIYSAESNDVFTGLPMKIMMCLGLEVSKEDVYPKVICQECNNELQRFYNFKKNCTTTFRKLKACLSDVKTTTVNIKTEESEEKQRSKISLDIENNVMSNENEETVVVIVSEDFVPQIIQPDESLRTAVSEDKQIIGHLDLQPVQTSEDIGIKIPSTQEDRIGKHQSFNTIDSLPTFIVTNLVEHGILAKNGNILELVDKSLNTFKIETTCGSEIVMELMEDEPESLAVTLARHTQRFKNFDTSGDRTRCEECGLVLATRGGLRRHLRVHSGERPYGCRVCGRAFAQREVLRRHELLHAERLPFQCSLCPKAYTQRAALEAHARVHAPPHARTPVPRPCSACPKVFLHPSGLSRHVKQVHQGRYFSCGECSSTFRDQSSLMRHVRAHQRRRAS